MPSNTRLKPNKACPVVLRSRDTVQILAFAHPLAGLQLVKGTIEPGEHPRDAALRELHEESGLSASSVLADLGVWIAGYENQVWSFHLCDMGDLPDAWMHRTADGGGHDFQFFWHPLAQPPNGQWHGVYQRALQFIANALAA